MNLSTAVVDFGNPTTITGNGTDLFCDSKSRIAGGVNIANAITVNCGSVPPLGTRVYPKEFVAAIFSVVCA